MKISQAVIPAAGLGTRFLPATKVVPKELLPLGNKPAIAWIVDECLDAGIREICFVISKGKELIPQFFRKDAGLEEELKKRGKEEELAELLRYDEIALHVSYQDRQLGDGHAVLQAKGWIRSDPFAVLFPDDVIVASPGCLKQMTDVYEEGVMVALLEVPRGEVSRYGIVAIRDTPPACHTEEARPSFGRLRMTQSGLAVSKCAGGAPQCDVQRLKAISDLIEKPDPKDAPSTLAVMGRFLLPSMVLRTLDEGYSSKGGERRIVDAIRANIGHVPVAGYVFEGTRYDLGTPEGYAEAVAKFGKG